MSGRNARVLWVLLLLSSGLIGGCKGCGREPERRDEAPAQAAREAPSGVSCRAAAECEDKDPCTQNECVDERCAVSLVPAGTACDNDTVCDGVARCDKNGRCTPSEPPVIDDGNPCTLDACDAARGALHETIPVDDFDACTADACDPRTGEITHVSMPIDDGNDCTLDSCDPRAGVRHEQPNGKYTCAADCEAGFHPASRSRAPECGSREALRTFCAPDCGSSFYTCAASCPKGYQRKSVSPGGTCGTNPSILLFCTKG